MIELTVFYDAECPLCVSEINYLQANNHSNKVAFVDLNDEAFHHQYPQINPIRAQQVIHGQLPWGQIITGLDVTCMAWRLVGKGKFISILRWPIISFFADIGYRFFAANRHLISRYYYQWFVCSKCSK